MRKLIVLFLLSTFFVSSCDHDDEMKHNKDLSDLIEKENVLKTVNSLFVSTDNREWTEVKKCFSDSVLFDMKSLTGIESSVISAEDIVNAWDNGLKDLQAIHHQVGNYMVEIKNNEADVFCYGTASHYLPNRTGNNVRTFVGSYNFHLVKSNSSWKIDRFKFNFKYLDGNADLENS